MAERTRRKLEKEIGHGVNWSWGKIGSGENWSRGKLKAGFNQQGLVVQGNWLRDKWRPFVEWSLNLQKGYFSMDSYFTLKYDTLATEKFQ